MGIAPPAVNHRSVAASFGLSYVLPLLSAIWPRLRVNSTSSMGFSTSAVGP